MASFSLRLLGRARRSNNIERSERKLQIEIHTETRDICSTRINLQHGLCYIRGIIIHQNEESNEMYHPKKRMRRPQQVLQAELSLPAATILSDEISRHPSSNQDQHCIYERDRFRHNRF